MTLTVVDAGVLIAVLDAHDAHHDAARQGLSAALERGDRIVVPASGYAEILVGPLREAADRADVVDVFLDALPASVEPATRQIARTAAELRARHGARLRLPDALGVATGLVLEAERVMTTDLRWPHVGIQVQVIGGSDASSGDAAAATFQEASEAPAAEPESSEASDDSG